MSRGARPFLALYRLGGGYVVKVLVHRAHAHKAARARRVVEAAGTPTPAVLGHDLRTARRRLRALLRAWGWPGADVRDACSLIGRGRPAYPSWPRRLRWAP